MFKHNVQNRSNSLQQAHKLMRKKLNINRFTKIVIADIYSSTV